ncbi:hypothetical protein KIW84_057280 [Lathyrus oleraceus]|uniref:MULE transposase domain-containing protein n=1 Tax=Pisum sativum TaxID=3888 RepID=A0A9D5AML8_PEA|nr:hypothetical protein KIW84_057280 [Pisum sativum]
MADLNHSVSNPFPLASFPSDIGIFNFSLPTLVTLVHFSAVKYRGGDDTIVGRAVDREVDQARATRGVEFIIENYDDFVSNDVHSIDGDTSDVELNDVEDDSSTVSNGDQSSDDDEDADNIYNDDLVERDAIVGDRLVSINSITSDEIRAMEFDTVDEVYEFYYRYGKCKGFAIRKIDVRTRGSEDRAHIDGLQSHGIRTCHIMEYMVAQKDKYPKTVVTDGDGAMREVIKQVFPDATYRLCAWHLNKNEGEKLKKSEFLEDICNASRL